MLHDEIEAPGGSTPEAVLAEYRSELADAVDEAGVNAVMAETGIDEGRLNALTAGDSVDFELSEAAAIYAVASNGLTADDVMLEVRDHLLMGMTTAVLDVDTIAANVDADLTAKEIQQKIEGRTSMSLAEYALLHQYIASERAR